MKIYQFNKHQYVSTSDAKKYLGISIHDLYNTINYHGTLATLKIDGRRYVELGSLRKAKRTGAFTGKVKGVN